MSLTSEHFSHLFLGVWSPSAWSMRLCLHALRMSTTFTELIFQVFISGLVCRLEVDWGGLSRLRLKYQPAWKGKLLVWSRSVRAVYIVQPLENSGHCDRGSKVRAQNRASQAKKEKKAKKRRSPCITDAHPCHAASPPSFLGSKLSPDVPQWRYFFSGSVLWVEGVPGWKKYNCQWSEGRVHNHYRLLG